MRAAVAPYLIALASVLVATLLRGMLDPFLENQQAYSLYYAAVAFTAWRCGVRAAIVSMAVGYVAADWLFATPRGALGPFTDDPDAWVNLATYAAISVGIIGLIAVRRAGQRAPITVLNTSELMAIATAVRQHRINSRELPAYLEGLNASPETFMVAANYEVFDLDSDELANQLEAVARRKVQTVSS